jgi:hypothetical protein
MSVDILLFPLTAVCLRRWPRHEPADTKIVTPALFCGARPCHSRDVAGVVIALQLALGLLTGFVEGWSVGDSVYFTFNTGLTIGYGDLVPKQTLRRALAIGIGYFGLFVTGVIAAIALLALASEPSGTGVLEPLQGFMTNPAGAAVVNAIGPIRQLVRGEDKAQRRYLVILPGTPDTHGPPFKSKGNNGRSTTFRCLAAGEFRRDSGLFVLTWVL